MQMAKPPGSERRFQLVLGLVTQRLVQRAAASDGDLPAAIALRVVELHDNLRRSTVGAPNNDKSAVVQKLRRKDQDIETEAFIPLQHLRVTDRAQVGVEDAPSRYQSRSRGHSPLRDDVVAEHLGQPPPCVRMDPPQVLLLARAPADTQTVT